MIRTNHSIRALAAVALVAAASLAFAVNDKASATSADKPLSYPQIVKAIEAGGATPAKTAGMIVGKTATVKLISTGDTALMVNKKDGVFFVCEKRVNGFKSGTVTSKISKYAAPDDGEVTVTLASCGG